MVVIHDRSTPASRPVPKALKVWSPRISVVASRPPRITIGLSAIRQSSCNYWPPRFVRFFVVLFGLEPDLQSGQREHGASRSGLICRPAHGQRFLHNDFLRIRTKPTTRRPGVGYVFCRRRARCSLILPSPEVPSVSRSLLSPQPRRLCDCFDCVDRSRQPFHPVPATRRHIMRKSLFILIALAAGVTYFAVGTGDGQPQKPATDAKPSGDSDGQAIRQMVAAFAEAFNKGDLSNIGGAWAEDAEYIDEAGKQIKGREAIVSMFKKHASEAKGAKIDLKVTNVRILKGDVALQDGVSVQTAADGTVDEGRFTAVWFKTDGKWMIR